MGAQPSKTKCPACDCKPEETHQCPANTTLTVDCVPDGLNDLTIIEEDIPILQEDELTELTPLPELSPLPEEGDVMVEGFGKQSGFNMFMSSACLMLLIVILVSYMYWSNNIKESIRAFQY